jgi:hypothetical protein
MIYHDALSLYLQIVIIPKLEAIPAVISRPSKAKECLLYESAEIIIEIGMDAEAINTKIRFLKLVLY